MMRGRMKYLKMEIDFIKSLKKSISDILIWKPYPDNHAVHIKPKMKEFINNNNIITDTPFKELMFSCKMIVIDHLSTAILESLAFNVPTVAFWHEADFPVVDEVLPDIARLQEVKIYHNDAEQAAKYVCEIYDNVDNWWQSYELQKVRKEFCHKYARVSDTMTKDWRQFLKNLSEK